MIDSYKETKDLFEKLNVDESHFVNSNDICTPIGCVEEIIEKIPEQFWAKNDLKILDPCAGNGNFHFSIYHRLIKYHTKENIMENILYFNEIN
jgi:adenine-specific DNA-methyltransferase